jgi:hypothetical protein
MLNIKRNIGISLIVLVITIIVIIILAGAVILSIVDNNLILNATEARFKSDVSAFNNTFQLWITSQYTLSEGAFNPVDVNVDNMDNKYDGKNIGEIIPSLKGEYLYKFKIIRGKLVYSDNTNANEIEWINELSVNTENNSIGKNIYINDSQDDYGTINSIKGFSLQNSTPNPDTPATILSAGNEGNIKLYTHAKNFFNPYLLTNASVVNDEVQFNITNSYDHLISKGKLGLLPNAEYNLKIIITENTATLPITFQISSTCAFNTGFSIDPGQTGEINKVITTKSDFKNVLYDIWLWHHNTGTGNFKFKMQITKGAEIQDYEPCVYTDYNITLPSNFMLASLTNGVSDSIDSVGLCTQKIVKSVLNGSENWSLRTVGTNTLEFLCSNALPNHVDNSIDNILCDRFIISSSSSDVEHIRSSSGSLYKDYVVLYINKSRLVTQDVAGLKTWLSSKPITVYYETTNVTTTKITLPIFKTYNGDTFVTTKNITQPVLDVSYIRGNN